MEALNLPPDRPLGAHGERSCSFSSHLPLSGGNFEVPPWWVLQCTTSFHCVESVFTGLRTGLSLGLRVRILCLGDAVSPASARADGFGFSFYVDIYYKWPCVRHSSYTCAHSAPHWTLTNGLSVWGRKQVSLGVKFALGAPQLRGPEGEGFRALGSTL